MHRPRLDQLEILMDRYAAMRLAPGPERIGEGRAAVLEAFASHASRISSRRQRRRPVLRGWSLAAAFALLLVAGSGLVAARERSGAAVLRAPPRHRFRDAAGEMNLRMTAGSRRSSTIGSPKSERRPRSAMAVERSLPSMNISTR